jgi:hypothetical protein
MDLVGVLCTMHDDCLQEAVEALDRAHLRHYDASGLEWSRRRLDDLFDLVLECLAKKNLGPICEDAQHVAEDRFNAGFGISEVQSGFNVLEEAIWHVVIPQLPADNLLEAAGLVGTVFGAGKDALARCWVSLATSQHVPSLDLTALFEGAAT